MEADARTPMILRYRPRRCFNFWTCHYQTKGELDAGKVFFWTVLVVLAAYGTIAGAIVGPITMGQAFDPFVYEDTCDVLSCDGKFALVHPHSAYRTPNLTIEVHDDRCKSRTNWKSESIRCFVLRTGSHDTDLAVWFNRPHLKLAIILLATGLPLLVFVVTWAASTFVYQAIYRSNVSLIRVLGLVILIALGMYGLFGTMWGGILIAEKLKDTESAQCRVSHCLDDSLAVVETVAPSPFMCDVVQLHRCEARLGSVVNCFSSFTVGGHVTLTKPGFAKAIGILVSSLFVVVGFILGGCFAGLKQLFKSCDAVDQAEFVQRAKTLSRDANHGKEDSLC